MINKLLTITALLLMACGLAMGGNAAIAYDSGTVSGSSALINGTVTNFPNMGVGMASQLGANVIATSQIPGMHNDWQDCLFVSGTWDLLVDSTNSAVISGTVSHPLSSGTTHILFSSGITTFANVSGTFSLSGTMFPMTGQDSCTVANYNNSYLEQNLPVVLGGTASDDWAVVQPYLGSNRTVFIDSTFGVSKSVRPASGSNWQGDGRHKIAILGNANMSVCSFTLTGSNVSTRDVTINNCVFDADGMMQNGATESLDSWNLQGDALIVPAVFGNWFGSCNNVHITNNQFRDSSYFNVPISNFNNGEITGNRFIQKRFYAKAPFIIQTYQPLHHDGLHIYGPCQGNTITGNYFFGGDDDQIQMGAIEISQENGFTYSVRRGHGGPITGNIIGHNVFDRDLRSISIGEQVGLTGTFVGNPPWNTEEFVSNNTFLANTGTVYDISQFRVAAAIQNHYVGYDVFSGTTSSAGITLSYLDTLNQGADNGDRFGTLGVTIDGMRTDVPVYAGVANFFNNDIVSIGGSYGDQVHRLKGDVIAAWRMQDGTDSSSNNSSLSSTNGSVSFTAVPSGNGRKVAIFSGTGCLVVTGTGMPRLNLMPEWTMEGQVYEASGNSSYGVLFTTGSGGSSSSTIAIDNSNNGQMLFFTGAVPYYQGTPFQTGTGHWYSVVVRKRLTDGKISLSVNQPNGPPSIGPWIVQAYSPYNQMEIGADTWDNRYINGMVANFTIWKRCVTDDEVNLLVAPTQDGCPFDFLLSGGVPPSYAIPGRFWPFNY